MPIPSPLSALADLAYTWFASRQSNARINDDADLSGARADAFVALTDAAALAGRQTGVRPSDRRDQSVAARPARQSRRGANSDGLDHVLDRRQPYPGQGVMRTAGHPVARTLDEEPGMEAVVVLRGTLPSRRGRPVAVAFLATLHPCPGRPRAAVAQTRGHVVGKAGRHACQVPSR